ncbi:MAG: FAD-dependent oxidoreductase [Candidatus Omnitrophica bacterium]|nr:FAD-dependent oxidoreductase [Candidatus Omnitrophota bacterium]
MPEIINLEFYQKIQRSASVKSFRFYLKNPINFIPGQFAKILFDKDNISDKELNKYLSFSASPGKNYIEFTKKLSQSEFSKKLDSLNKKDRVFIQAPLGNCTFKDEYKKIAFLIGGIGITPVISIIEYIVGRKLNTNLVLFYSNRTDKEIAFKRELDNWQKNNQNVKIIYTITDFQPKDSKIKKGHIDEEMVSETIKNYEERIFFIYGPPGMVSSMVKLCSNIGCRSDRVKKERFIGY